MAREKSCGGSWAKSEKVNKELGQGGTAYLKPLSLNNSKGRKAADRFEETATRSYRDEI